MKRHPAIVIALGLGFAAAVWAGAIRAGVEGRSRSCEIVLDYDEVEILQASSGVDAAEILSRFAQEGVQSVAITEETLGQMVAAGSVFVSSPRVTAGSSGSAQAGPSGLKAINSADWLTHARVAYHLATRLPDCVDEATAKELGDAGLVARYRESMSGAARAEAQSYMWGRELCVTGYRGCERAGMGLDLSKVARVRAAGLSVVARPVNYPGLTQRAIDSAVSDLAALGVGKAIFAEDEVLGLGGLESATARALVDHGVAYGSIEFSRQEGDAALRSLLGGEFVKVHSIETEEMPRYTPERAADRFVLAATERGARVLFVRLLLNQPGGAVEANLDYVASIATRLEQKGWSLGPAKPPEPVGTPGGLRFLIGLGTAAGCVLLLSGIAPLRAFGQVTVLVVLAITLGLFASVGGASGKHAVAFLAAIVFPVLGIVYARERLQRAAGDPRWPKLADALIGLVSAAALAAVGGLFVGALLFDRLHVSGVQQFRGVKLALFLPILGVASIFVAEAYGRSERWGEWWSRIRARAVGLLYSPTLIWQGAVVVLVLGALAIAMTRTGNEPAFAVSSLELKLRAFLENIFAVRPRSKEFLIGHPALALGFFLLLRGRMRFVAAAMAVGALGQASIVNTFCHIHTPLSVSLVRTLNGVLLGLVLAAVVCLIWGWLTRPRSGGPSPRAGGGLSV